MRHHFFDHHSAIQSPIQRLDARVKIILACVLLISIVITPNGRFLDFIFFLPLLIYLLYLSNLPKMAIVKKTLYILPFVGMIAISLPFMGSGIPIAHFQIFVPLIMTDTGLLNFASVIIKAILAIWTMTLLTETTRFNELLVGFQKLGVPLIFTSILGFMYRYIFLFVDETERLNIGRTSRSFGHNKRLAIKGVAYMLSSIFLRSFERGERVYQAMCARGFNGTVRSASSLKITAGELLILGATLITILLIKMIGHHYG